MIQTQENDDKPHFGPNLSSSGPNPGRHWLHQSPDIMVSYHHVQYK